VKSSAVILVVLSVSAFLAIGLLVATGPKPALIAPGTVNVTVELDLGGQSSASLPDNSSYQIELRNATAYSALKAASENGNFTLVAEWYPNFRSHRVSEIAGVRDGTDNRYWQYYINGVYMDKGSDLAGLRDGDVVRWVFRSAMQ
jgi:hypothetical protein